MLRCPTGQPCSLGVVLMLCLELDSDHPADATGNRVNTHSCTRAYTHTRTHARNLCGTSTVVSLLGKLTNLYKVGSIIYVDAKIQEKREENKTKQPLGRGKGI